MDNLMRKKVVLSLLDNDPKDANNIATEICESLATVEEVLPSLISDNICEKINKDEVDHYVVKNDIETFAQLLNDFLSDKDEHKDQIEQFITSDYYLNRIDVELVDYVLKRFYLDSIYHTDENKIQIGRILLASPSALHFALYEDTARFGRLASSSTDENSDWLTELLNSDFMTPIIEMLIADMKFTSYGFLHAKLGFRMVEVVKHVRIATLNGMYVEAVGGGDFSLSKAAESIPAGQLVSYVDPMDICNDGLAMMHLGKYQGALNNYDKALNIVNDPINKIIILNNKGLTFLRSKQYQKAIECFDEGIAFNTEGDISILTENKRIAEEYLTIATDADNLTEPTQVSFILNQPVPFEETLFYEFKEIKGNNPSNRITKDSDEYTVAFLNREGGRIFWGVRDGDRITVGVKLDERQRDNVRRIVSEKLWGIRPPISDDDWDLVFHQAYDLQGNPIEDLWVIELVISPQQEKQVFYTNSGKLYVKTPGGKQKLLGQQVTEFILDRLRDNLDTE